MGEMNVKEFMGSKSKMLMIAEKESFIVRVLTKKAVDADVDCIYARSSVNDINKHMDEVSLITLFMDDREIPSADVLHFLNEKMTEKDLRMILIGESEDVRKVCEQISGDLIYKSFYRPVDNAQYVETITEYISKLKSGALKKSILIVDDDPQYLSLVREWLKGTYSVTMANSGMQAIKWLGKNKVDLILLDHEMPVTSGPQVLEMLRSDTETASIPVMFLTGKSDKKSVMEVVSLRPEGYFLKTIKKDELLEKLMEYFILHKKP